MLYGDITMPELKYEHAVKVYFKPNPPYWHLPMMERLTKLSSVEATEIKEIFKNNRNVERVEIVK